MDRSEISVITISISIYLSIYLSILYIYIYIIYIIYIYINIYIYIFMKKNYVSLYSPIRISLPAGGFDFLMKKMSKPIVKFSIKFIFHLIS